MLFLSIKLSGTAGMKIFQYENLTKFLNMLFEFIKENYSGPVNGKINNYDEMLNIILNSEYTGFNCRRDTDQYSVDFSLTQKIDKEEVYMFLFGKDESYGDNSLEIDLQEMGLNSYFTFSWNEQKLPPFLTDFVDNEGRLLISYADGSNENKLIDGGKYMTFDEFQVFLNRNRKQ
jgi:hypothetical protein